MKILFLGDIVGRSGCEAIKKNLPKIILDKKIDFCIVNGENAADQGVGITEKISKDLFNSGVDVITTGNHVWDQKETTNHIEKDQITFNKEENYYENLITKLKEISKTISLLEKTIFR